MSGGVYYNDQDRFCCAWLRNLIAAGHLPAGEVDERPIQEVTADDVRGFTQAHFFAGIGGWALALGLAGWPASEPVWTGSCPCQPFSAAGKGERHADDRHLWPAWARLVAECRPPVVFGEQVASRAGRLWLAAVRLDLEGMGYGVGAADLCAAGVGAPHLRQRLWFVADAQCDIRGTGRLAVESREGDGAAGAGPHVEPRRCGNVGGVAHPERAGWPEGRAESGDGQAPSGGESGELGHTNAGRCPETQAVSRRAPTSGGVSGASSFWSACDWLPCRDGKARPVPTESALFPLAARVPNRVGLLRGSGNAIVPQVAAAFVSAYMETMP